MSSAPETDGDLAVTVKRVHGGAVSNWLNDNVSVGDLVETSPPSGTFWIRGRRPSDHGVLRRQRHHAGDLHGQERPGRDRGGRSASCTPAGIPTRSSSTGPSGTSRPGTRDGSTVRRHFDSVSGFPDAAAVVDVVGGDPDADFYVCGPGPVHGVGRAHPARSGRGTRSRSSSSGSSPRTGPRCRHRPSHRGAAVPATIVLQLQGKRHEIGLPPRRHRARDRPAGRPSGALLLRGRQLRHLHGPPSRGVGHHAGEQRPDPGRGGGGLGPHLPVACRPARRSRIEYEDALTGRRGRLRGSSITRFSYWISDDLRMISATLTRGSIVPRRHPRAVRPANASGGRDAHHTS